MQPNTLRNTAGQKDRNTNQNLSPATDLITEIPGINEPSAIGKLMQIITGARGTLLNIDKALAENRIRTLNGQLREDKGELIDLIAECRARLYLILAWNNEKLKSLREYFAHPHVDLEEIAAGQEAERRLRMAISTITEFLKA